MYNSRVNYGKWASSNEWTWCTHYSWQAAFGFGDFGGSDEDATWGVNVASSSWLPVRTRLPLLSDMQGCFEAANAIML